MHIDSAIKTVSRNVVVNVAGAFWQFVLIIIGTRLVLQQMGADSFGILALVGGTAGYFLYLDIGIGETVTKKVSETQDAEKLSRTVSTLFFFAAGFGLPLAMLTALFALFGIPALFSFAPPLMQSAISMFLVIAAGLWLLYPLSMFAKVFVGLNRLDVYNAQRVIFQTLILVMILAALRWHNSAEVAVAAITLGGLLWKTAAYLTLRKMYPHIEISRRHFDPALLRGLLRYQGAATASQAAGHTVYQCDIYMIGILLDPASVAFYSIANTIAMKLTEVAGVLGTAAFPMISGFHGANMGDTVRKSFKLGTKLMAVALMPLVVFLFVHAEPVITLWVGPAYLPAALALKWLLAAWFINAASVITSLTVKAVDRPGLEARIGVVVAVANVGLDYFFIVKYGFVGAVYATFITQLLGFIALNAAVCRHLGLPSAPFLMRLLGTAALGALFGAVYLLPLPPWLFAVPLALHTALFFAAGYWLVLDAEERMIMGNMLRIARNRAAG